MLKRTTTLPAMPGKMWESMPNLIKGKDDEEEPIIVTQNAIFKHLFLGTCVAEDSSLVFSYYMAPGHY